eukprot:6179044-Amphidinium_carterae.1
MIVELIEESWVLSFEEARWAITKESPTGPQALEDRCFACVNLWGCYFAHLTWADFQADYQAKKEEIMDAIAEIQSQSPQIVKGFLPAEVGSTVACSMEVSRSFIVLTEKEMRKALNVPRLNKGMLAGCCCVQMPKEENPSELESTYWFRKDEQPHRTGVVKTLHSGSAVQYALQPQNHGFEKQRENMMSSVMEKEGLGAKQLQDVEKLVSLEEWVAKHKKVATRKGNDALTAKAHLDAMGEDSDDDDDDDDEESDEGNEEGENELGGQAACKGIEGASAASTPASVSLKRAPSLQSLFAVSSTLQTPPAKRAVVSEA